MDVLLKNLSWVSDVRLEVGDIRIRSGKIAEIGTLRAKGKEQMVDFSNHYVYPGLVNAHDHLEMNLYPRQGVPPYSNYTQWARDIYKPTESPVREIESVDLKLRLLWGGLKNLISGVTTVVHHNPWHRSLGQGNFPVRVLKKYRWAHSLAFEKQNRIISQFPTKSTTPFIIHAAEGIDEYALGEIHRLYQLRLLRENTVLVHAVGLTEEDLTRIEETRTSIVWCPSSNLFMFGKTANVLALKKNSRVALGTDSTMTGPPSLFDEMRVAALSGLATSKEIVDMVTRISIGIFNLPGHQIKEGNNADFLVVPISIDDYFENLVAMQTRDVTAVFLDGQFRFGDPAVMRELKMQLPLWKFGGVEKGLACDVSQLVGAIHKQLNTIHVKDNPLWQRIAG